MTARTATKKRLPEQVTLHHKRYYDLHDGTKLPSVTTVLSTALNKPALVGWAAKTVAEEALVNLPQIVKMSRTDRDGAVKFLKGRPYAQRDEAADAGTKAHDLAECYVLGKPFEVPSPDTDLGKTLAQFLKFLEEWQPEFEATEAVVVNRTIGWAGTLDAIARIPALGNRLLVIDYKTGKSGPYAEWALQVGGAYANAEELWLPSGESIPMPAIEGAAVLRLRPTFYALHEIEADLGELQKVFAQVVGVANWSLDADDASPFGKKIERSA